MARLFVTSDNLATRIELISDDVEGNWRAYCAGCTPAYDRYDSGADLLRGERARFNLEDAIEEVVMPHADRCTRCADSGCRNDTRHDSGHRCRKEI
jgi:hypothetical protein